MQLPHRRTASPTAPSTSTYNDTADVIISLNIPPVLTLVIGETTTASASQSSTSHVSSSSGSSSTLAKGVVTTSESMTTTRIPVPSSTSRSSGGGAISFPTGTIGDTVYGTPSQAESDRKHVRLTCVPFPERLTYYYHPVPTMTAKTSDVYGAAAFTMETITIPGTMTQSTTMTPTGSDVATSTSSGGPISSTTPQAQSTRRRFPRQAIIGIVVALVFILIGSVVLILRRRRNLLRNQVPSITGSSQRLRDDFLAQPRSSLRNFNTGPRSKWSDSSNDDDEGGFAHPEFSDNEGSTRTGKRLPSIIIHPSASNFYWRENQDRLSIISNISTDSQYILAQPRQTTADVDLLIPDPFSPPMPVTPTGSFISIPDITVQSPPNSYRVTSYRPIDRVIPRIPPVPSSPPPLPPGSPSRASRDPFKDPPSPSTS